MYSDPITLTPLNKEKEKNDPEHTICCSTSSYMVVAGSCCGDACLQQEEGIEEFRKTCLHVKNDVQN